MSVLTPSPTTREICLCTRARQSPRVADEYSGVSGEYWTRASFSALLKSKAGLLDELYSNMVDVTS